MTQPMIHDSLSFYADVMRNTNEGEHREHGAFWFKKLFEKQLESENAFSYKFPTLQDKVSFLYPPDSSFRMISWQVDLQEDYQYHGFIQTNDGTLFSLDDHSKDLEDLEYEVLGTDSWYGMLYYDMIPLDENNFLLLGYNAVDHQISRKVAEILHWEDGIPSFGHELFFMDQDPVRPTVKTRIVLEFSELAAVRLTYDKQAELLFFDNLIPVESYEKENEVVMVQDGSYNGFYKEGNRLIYKEKLFDVKMDSPPRQRPVQNEKRDILGKPSGG